MDSDLPLLTTTRVSGLLGVHLCTVDAMLKRGDLPFVRDSAGRRLFKMSDVQRVIKAREARGTRSQTHAL